MPAPASSMDSLLKISSFSDRGAGVFPGLLVNDDLAVIAKRTASKLLGTPNKIRPSRTDQIWVTLFSPSSDGARPATLARWADGQGGLCVYELGVPLNGGHDLRLPPLAAPEISDDGVRGPDRIVEPNQEVFGWSRGTAGLIEATFTVRSRPSSTQRFEVRPVTPLGDHVTASDFIGSPVWSYQSLLGVIESVSKDRVFQVTSNLRVHSFLPKLSETQGQLGDNVRELYRNVFHSLHTDLRNASRSGLRADEMDALEAFLQQVTMSFERSALVEKRGVVFGQLVAAYIEQFRVWTAPASTSIERWEQMDVLAESSARLIKHALFVGESFTLQALTDLRETLSAALPQTLALHPRRFAAVLSAMHDARGRLRLLIS